MSAPRDTKQRRAISDMLTRTGGFRSAQQLHEDLCATGSKIGLTTVYRNLQALADAHVVDALRDDSGEMRYRSCSSAKHHHHLVCRNCGTTVEVGAEAVESWAAKVAAENGFSDISHTVEIFGLCARCTQSS